MNRSLLILGLALLTFSFTGCKKVEGPGGRAMIKGRLYANVFDGANNLINQYWLADHDVFIIYGNEEGENFYDDDVKTSYDGSFEFNYLETGNYQVFTYSKCPTCYSGDTVLLYDIELTDKKEIFDLGTITVRRNP